jgi:hypothetical protein
MPETELCTPPLTSVDEDGFGRSIRALESKRALFTVAVELRSPGVVA